MTGPADPGTGAPGMFEAPAAYTGGWCHRCPEPAAVAVRLPSGESRELCARHYAELIRATVGR
jgi:hypothetical protein